MNRYYNILISLCFAAFCGCEKSGEIASSNTTGNYPYYIEAYLETGRYATAHIAKTTSLSETQPASEIFATDTDSVANFYSNFHALLLKDGVVVDSLTGPYDNNYDYWRETDFNWSNWYYLKGNNHLIQQGGNYQMVVKLKGHPNMVASCVVPGVVPIQSLDTVNTGESWKYYPWQDSTWGPEPANATFMISFQDPPGQQNYYALECYGVWKVAWYNSQNPPIPVRWGAVLFDNEMFDNHWNNNTVWTYAPFQGFFSDKLFNGQEKSFGFTTASFDSLIAVHLVNISVGYYERLLTTYLFMINSINMYASPIPVYSNFSNAVGFLAGRTVSADTFNVKTLKFYSQSKNNINNSVNMKH